MKFDFEIKNLGKVKHAKLNLAPFTVIAGANSSGKSFISRALYSFFSTINKDHVTADSMSNVTRARALARAAYNSTYEPSYAVQSLFYALSELLSSLENAIGDQFGDCTYLEQWDAWRVCVKRFVIRYLTTGGGGGGGAFHTPIMQPFQSQFN
ncbi:ATP-binding protein [Vibrio alginolyticus]|uniref:AAA family ATPase n=1 Tax=Vibrio alginolyticus TaxID=663 RepID=UPI001EEC66BC|nr:AAA family ATPase [Vibrio alginolyticus]MCG6317494.1 ATP-binding protein [Vibrio alginolyticus]